jgi:hypothetical protein
MRLIYYYLRDDHGHPRVTVCLAKMAEGFWTRGISICSYSEKVISKKDGRERAFDRAMSAGIRGISDLEINREEAYDVLNQCCDPLEKVFRDNDSSDAPVSWPVSIPAYKSECLRSSTDFTTFEKKLISKIPGGTK